MIRNLNSINILIIAFAVNLYLIIVLSPIQLDPTMFMDDGTMSVLTIILIITAWILCYYILLIILDSDYIGFACFTSSRFIYYGKQIFIGVFLKNT